MGCRRIACATADGNFHYTELWRTIFTAATVSLACNAVASEVVGTNIALGVLPLGTLNHFAKALHLPLDIEEAAQVVLTGSAIEVDVGEVNGRINETQLERVRARLLPLSADVTKIVVTHHPLDLPQDHGGNALVGRARMAMAVFVQCRVDMLLAGHLHVGQTGNTAARYAIPGILHSWFMRVPQRPREAAGKPIHSM